MMLMGYVYCVTVERKQTISETIERFLGIDGITGTYILAGFGVTVIIAMLLHAIFGD